MKTIKLSPWAHTAIVESLRNAMEDGKIETISAQELLQNLERAEAITLKVRE